ncbi:uncharacterized protein LOC117105637 isoform X2 [Anneissia japonica]|nr:uncharacterized protein LOC117105637 isoform X2 [Anneissia japonica]
MDKQALSYGPTLTARVRAVSENAESEWKYEETKPVDDGSIGPPAISLESIEAQSVSFRMELPKTPYVDSNNVVLLVDSSEFILKTITKEISISCNKFIRTNYTTGSWWIWEDLEENTSYNITSYSIYGKCPECSRSYTADLVAVRTLSSKESSTSEPEITDLPNVLLAYIMAFVLALVLFLVVVRHLSRFLKRRVTNERFKFPVWWDSITTDNAYVCTHRSNEPPELFDPLKEAPPNKIPGKDECEELLKPKTECKKALQPQEEFEIDEYVTHAFIASLTLNFTSHQT